MTPQEQQYSISEYVTYRVCVCGDLDCKIPFGYCHCRCGNKAPLAHRTVPAWNAVKGLPRRFIIGHNRHKRPIPEDAKPFRLDGVYCRLIPLGKGLYAIVNAVDYDWLMQWKWSAQWNKYTKSFYAVRREYRDGKETAILMHREILGLPRKSDGRCGDHINHQTIDNRRSNIRIATRSQNLQNQLIRSNNTSGYKGVSYHKPSRKWLAHIGINGRLRHLGGYSTREEAAEVYRKAASELYGEFAHNG